VLGLLGHKPYGIVTVGTIIKMTTKVTTRAYNVDTLEKGTIHTPGRMEQDSIFHHAT
jgi:hypothetical protein